MRKRSGCPRRRSRAPPPDRPTGAVPAPRPRCCGAVDPLGTVDLGWGARSSAPWPLHHAWRLRRLGRLEALRPPDDGARGPRGAAAARRVLARGADRRRARSCRRSPRRSGARGAACGSRAGTRRRTSRSSAASRRPCCASCWPRRSPRGRRARAAVGRRAAPGLHAEPRRRCAPTRASSAAAPASACALDARERLLHCHHEKLVVVDDEVAFVGGVDLTDLGGDRWDTRAAPGPRAPGLARRRHPAARPGRRRRRRAPRPALDRGHRRGAAAGAGPGAAPATRRSSCCARSPRASTTQLPRRRLRDPGGLHARAAAARASSSTSSPSSSGCRRSSTCWPASCATRRAERFRVVVVLPSKANNGEEDTRGMLAHLADADAGRGRFLATTIDAMTGSTVDRLYVHAKVGIVDDRWLTIGSANLNAHSFFNDTEVNVAACDPALARATRLRLWASTSGCRRTRSPGDPATSSTGSGVPIARRERERRRRGERARAPAARAHAGLAQARAAARADGRGRRRRLAAGTGPGGRRAAVRAGAARSARSGAGDRRGAWRSGCRRRRRRRGSCPGVTSALRRAVSRGLIGAVCCSRPGLSWSRL